MSQYGHPSGPQGPKSNSQTPAPSYPTQPGGYPQFPQTGDTPGSQPPGYPAPGPASSQPVPAPRNTAGAGGQAPYPQQGQAPYPQQGQAPYPQQGQAPYPQQGQASYPQQGQGPYPQQGQNPFPQQGQAPRPGQAPYPQQGQAPYPNPGQAPYPSLGQAPSPGQAPYPSPGQAPYPNKGPAPNPQQGQAPYPQPGQAPYPQPGQAPYPQQGQSPYPQRGPAPISQGQAPYPGQGQAPYPQAGPATGQSSSPYPGQNQPAPGQYGQAPYPAAGQPPHSQAGTGTHPGQPGQSPYPNQAQQQPYQGQGYGPGGGHPGQQAPPPSMGYQPPPGTAGARVAQPGSDQFKSKIELHIECKNLLNLDIMSKSDPCAVLYMMVGARWEEVGRTENVVNNLNPKFSRSFVVNYFFEEVQKVLISVYDIDNATPQLNDDDFLGQVETTLGQLVSNTPMTAPLKLKNGAKAGQGTIIIRTEEIKEGMETVHMTFRAQKLDSKDLFGKSDPYLEILKATPDGNWQVVHRTEVIKNNLNPSWRPFELPLQKLCGGNKQQTIKFDCYDWDSDGSHDYIGGFTTTVDEMAKAAQQQCSWPCVNPQKKAKKKSYTNSGTIFLTSIKVIKDYSFLDFIMGGTQINFTVGVDFTASNGNPKQSSSLHFINPYQPNEYMAAIKSVGDVCQDYDTDKLFPALGFGAKIPPKFEVSHEFAINFNPQNPYCQGIDGVLQAYNNCIQHVQLYGPTNAAPIINHVANFAAAAQREEGSKGAHAYFILLMLTDGVLSDMSNTRSAIVEASKLPMSLIIVGVGQADFNDMQILDGDNGVLRSAGGEPVKRDIVQFVPFRDFRNSSPVELARHVLAEVPKQVTDYYKMRGLQPKPKPTS